MDRELFVDAVRLVVRDSAVTNTISVLSQPPGRNPDQTLVGLSGWFDSLPLQDRQNIERIVQITAHDAVFGMLCVLDGARAIEDGPMKGTVDLRYYRGHEDISLNDYSGAPLHELL